LGDERDFQPDGKRVVAASWDNIVRIWDADTSLEIGLLKGRAGSVLSVDFSADGGGIFRIRISSMFSITSTSRHVRRSRVG
jgi:WD40 repeat protein